MWSWTSERNTKQFKEKILDYYEHITRNENNSAGPLEETFWDEMFLLPVKSEALVELVRSNVRVHALFGASCKYLETESTIRQKHALEVREIGNVYYV
jgi:hypothetical protein